MAQILPIAHQGKPLDIGRSPQRHHKGSVDQAQHSSPLHPVESADSDEVARVKRDEAARDSWMMAPAVTE
jgi:hypothetical protein